MSEETDYDCRERCTDEEVSRMGDCDPLPLSTLGEERIASICKSLTPCISCESKYTRAETYRSSIMEMMEAVCSSLGDTINKVKNSRVKYLIADKRYQAGYFTFYDTLPASYPREAEEEEVYSIKKFSLEVNILSNLTSSYQLAVEDLQDVQCDVTLCTSNQLYRHLIKPLT